MNKQGIIVVLLLNFAFGGPLFAAGHKNVLQTISSTVEDDHMHILLRFNELPPFEVSKNGRRVDLVLEHSVPAKDLVPLHEDGRLVRMVTREEENSTQTSFYFRYPPQNVAVKRNEAASSLMLDILLGNPISLRYPELASKLNGISLLRRSEVDYTNPLRISRFSSNWKSLFAKYESPVTIRPAMQLTIPPFPMASALQPHIKTNKWLPENIKAEAGKGNWNQVRQLITQQIEREENNDYRNRLLLTACETMIRQGEYRPPLRLLQRIMHRHPDSQLGRFAHILLLALQAQHEDPCYSYFELKALNDKIKTETEIRPSFSLLLAETALLSGLPDEAASILQRGDIAYDTQLHPVWRLRQGDVRYEQGKMIQALISYIGVARERDIFPDHPRSLAWFADTLYTNLKIEDAATRYQQLIDAIDDRENKGLAMYRLAMCLLHQGKEKKQVNILLLQVQDAFSGTEAWYRARLKQTDIAYLDKKIHPDQAVSIYHSIAEQGPRREIREEAAFKEALVLALAGDNLASVNLCLDILRDFRSGRLQLETRALLLQRVPAALHELIHTKEYIKALVLAKKTRFFFVRGWLDPSILHDIARGYMELGAYARAVHTYQYILSLTRGRKREQAYLPLLHALYRNGQYELVEDYGDRFFFRYPHSELRNQILQLRIQALAQRGLLKRAARLLDSNQDLNSTETATVAAAIYFDLGRWQDVIRVLTPASETESLQPLRCSSWQSRIFRSEILTRLPPSMNSLPCRQNREYLSRPSTGLQK